MNLQDAIHAGRAFLHAQNGDIVPPETIIQRSATCKACPSRKEIQSLPAYISKALGSFANSDKVPEELHNNQCGACGCSLLLLVPAILSDITDDHLNHPRPDACWVLTEAADNQVNQIQ